MKNKRFRIEGNLATTAPAEVPTAPAAADGSAELIAIC
jgi:hypothetical protein